MIRNSLVSLRSPELSDIKLLYDWENNLELWEVSNTFVPFSKYILEKYIENSHLDIFTTKQIRFIIEKNTEKEPVGLIDLFDFEPFHSRAGVGIMINNSSDKQKGYAFAALELLKKYSSEILLLNQLYCHITEGNKASLRLFEKSGFSITGKKEKWIKTKSGFKDVYFLQLFF